MHAHGRRRYRKCTSANAGYCMAGERASPIPPHPQFSVPRGFIAVEAPAIVNVGEEVAGLRDLPSASYTYLCPASAEVHRERHVPAVGGEIRTRFAAKFAPNICPQPGVAGSKLAAIVLALAIAVETRADACDQRIAVGEAHLCDAVVEVVHVDALPDDWPCGSSRQRPSSIERPSPSLRMKGQPPSSDKARPLASMKLSSVRSDSTRRSYPRVCWLTASR